MGSRVAKESYIKKLSGRGAPSEKPLEQCRNFSGILKARDVMQSSTWASQKMPSQTMGWQRLTQLVCTLELPYCLVFIASCRAARHRSLDYDHTPQLRKGIESWQQMNPRCVSGRVSWVGNRARCRGTPGDSGIQRDIG